MTFSHGCKSLSVLALTACVSAEAPLSEAERLSVVASVDSATRAFEEAERTRDPERVISHLAPEFYMYNDGVRSGYEPVAEGIRGGLAEFRHFEPGWTDLEVIILGRNAAVASFTFHDSIIDPTGQLLQSQGPTTLVWERRGVDWLIVYADADHYPVPN